MQFDRETDWMNIIAKFHNFGRLLKIRFKRGDILSNGCLFARLGDKTTLPSVRSNSCTRRPLTDTNFSFRRVPISFAKMRASHSQFIVVFPENTHSNLTTTEFLTFPIYYKLHNAQWIEEIQCVQNIVIFFLMCEFNVTVKLYRAACRLMLIHISS